MTKNAGNRKRQWKANDVVQPQAVSVDVGGRSVAVYAIEVVGSGQDRLVRELYRMGCTVIDQRIPGYLVVSLTLQRYQYVMGLRSVAKMFPAAGTEFERPVTMPETERVNQVGDLVRVVSGHYEGLSGIIRSISGEEIQLEIVMFGRLIALPLRIESVQPIPVPEAWRG